MSSKRPTLPGEEAHEAARVQSADTAMSAAMGDGNVRFIDASNVGRGRRGSLSLSMIPWPRAFACRVHLAYRLYLTSARFQVRMDQRKHSLVAQPRSRAA